jgi:hypothetical protein
LPGFCLCFSVRAHASALNVSTGLKYTLLGGVLHCFGIFLFRNIFYVILLCLWEDIKQNRCKELAWRMHLYHVTKKYLYDTCLWCLQDSQTNRTLTLISKTIQSLGNLVSCRSAQQTCKEEYMSSLYKAFCTEKHIQAVRQFLEIISASSNPGHRTLDSPVVLKEG